MSMSGFGLLGGCPMNNLIDYRKILMRVIQFFVSCVFFTTIAYSFFSCKTLSKTNEVDRELIETGILGWNEQEPEAARFYWMKITDAQKREAYIGYVDRYTSAVTAADALIALPPAEERAYLALFMDLHTSFSAFPPSLHLQDRVALQMAGIGAGRARAMLAQEQFPEARDLLQKVASAYGATEEISRLLLETDILLGIQKAEADADLMIADARSHNEFYSKMTAYEKGIVSFAKTEKLFVSDVEKYSLAGTAPFSTVALRLKKKRQDASVEMERSLRDRLYSFKERIGEEFARVPEEDKIGEMSLSEMLAFQEEIKENIDRSYDELKEFAQRFPSAINRGLFADVEAQKAVIESRILSVVAEIGTAKDIASRGKTVVPIMIGLFNPAPGTKAGEAKSRPAKIRGTISGKSDYWWGMVSVEDGTLNDLVITMDDARTVRVFPENTKSGALVKNMKDLVNSTYKVGNSWPVLNVGNQLPSGKYFMEVQTGEKMEYSGEAVIYSSYIMRMR